MICKVHVQALVAELLLVEFIVEMVNWLPHLPKRVLSDYRNVNKRNVTTWKIRANYKNASLQYPFFNITENIRNKYKLSICLLFFINKKSALALRSKIWEKSNQSAITVIYKKSLLIQRSCLSIIIYILWQIIQNLLLQGIFNSSL